MKIKIYASNRITRRACGGGERAAARGWVQAVTCSLGSYVHLVSTLGVCTQRLYSTKPVIVLRGLKPQHMSLDL